MKFSKRRDSASARNLKSYMRHDKEVNKSENKKEDQITKAEDLREKENDQDGSIDY
jgi:hypothetical protein